MDQYKDRYQIILNNLADIAIKIATGIIRVEIEQNNIPYSFYLTELVKYNSTSLNTNSTEPESLNINDVNHLTSNINDEKHHIFNKNCKLFLVIFSIFGLIVLIWILAAVIFMRINIGSNRIPIYESNSKVASTLDSKDDSYYFDIKYGDGYAKPFKLADIGLKIDNQKTIKLIDSKKLNLSDYLTWWKPIKLDVNLEINSQKFNNFINNSIDVVVKPAINANLTLVNGSVDLSPGINGKSYELDNAANTILNEVSVLSIKPIYINTKIIQPEITSTQFKDAVNIINSVIKKNIQIKIAGHNINPSSDDIFAWLTISPNKYKNNIIVSVNDTKVLNYINAISAKYNYSAKSQVQISHPDGSIGIFSAGANGQEVIGQSEVASQISQSLLNDKSIQVSIPTSIIIYKSVSPTVYPKWIEVDVTTKKLYAYQQDTLVNTFLVTAGAPATPTVIGQYKVYAKLLDQNMWGYNPNGTEYYQPNVQWIEYFYQSYAIHGNYWAPISDFGTINSSHGCVGLPNSEAEWIYNWAPIGTIIVTHY